MPTSRYPRLLERVHVGIAAMSRRGFWQQFLRRTSYAAILEQYVHDVNQAMLRFSAQSVLAIAVVCAQRPISAHSLICLRFDSSAATLPPLLRPTRVYVQSLVTHVV